jgi:hypothetical protein
MIGQTVQMLVLGPRLILGVREHHARLVANCDEGPGVASIAFQERYFNRRWRIAWNAPICTSSHVIFVATGQ